MILFATVLTFEKDITHTSQPKLNPWLVNDQPFDVQAGESSADWAFSVHSVNASLYLEPEIEFKSMCSDDEHEDFEHGSQKSLQHIAGHDYNW